MEKKIFSDLSQQHIIQLGKLLQKVFINLDAIATRKNTLRIAGIDEHFIADIDFNLNIYEVVDNLLAKFKSYSISSRKPNHHPLVAFLSFIYQQPERFNLDDQDMDFCENMINIGQGRMDAIFQSQTKKNPQNTSTKNQANNISITQNHLGTGDNVTGDKNVTNYYNTVKEEVSSQNKSSSMTDSSNNQNKLIFASTFLSHSSQDKPLVEKVAKHLSRRGILTWLDRNELSIGSLNTALKEAIQRQLTMTVFLSEDSVKSSWCHDEIRWAIESKEGHENLLPVYLDDPFKLVNKHELLRTRFLHPDGDRVNQLGYCDYNNPRYPNPEAIADMIADTVYRRSIPSLWSEIAIILDQRGNGKRRGEPKLPANVENSEIPALVFRPDIGSKKQGETLVGESWQEVSQTMINALSNALGTIKNDPRKVRIFGYAQTGLMWLLGQYFNRTTSANLYAYDRHGVAISNKDQIRHMPLTGGNPQAAKLIYKTLKELRENQPEIALGVGSSAKRARQIQSTLPNNIPLFWIESGLINNSEEAMNLTADIVASIEHLQQNYGMRKLMLFWTTANHVAVLTSANLTSHVIARDNIKYMEWNHDSQEYFHLPMPSF